MEQQSTVETCRRPRVRESREFREVIPLLMVIGNAGTLEICSQLVNEGSVPTVLTFSRALLDFGALCRGLGPECRIWGHAKQHDKSSSYGRHVYSNLSSEISVSRSVPVKRIPCPR